MSPSGAAFWNGSRTAWWARAWLSPDDLDLIQVIDEPDQIVEAIFKHYETRGFAPLPDEREMLLNL